MSPSNMTWKVGPKKTRQLYRGSPPRSCDIESELKRLRRDEGNSELRASHL